MVNKIRSIADYLTDWRRLLNLLDANVNEGTLPEMPVLRGRLEEALVSLELSSAQQDAIRAESKDNAEDSRLHLRAGSDVALQLRAAIRSHLGPRNPKLAEFRVRVLAPRRPKPTAPAPEDSKVQATPRRGSRRRKVKPEAEAAEPAAEPEPVA